MLRGLQGLLDKFRAGTRLDYDEAKQLASSDDVKVREEVAAKPNVQPEILYFLAQDRSASVRAIIAQNDATPRQADLLLTDDKDESVRSQLAAKIAALAPGLTANEVDKIRRMTYQALEKLARDQAVKVRQIVAETVQEMVDAPAEIIRHLAEDTELVVCAPVLENSPILTDLDLIRIINITPVDGAISAIAKRTSLHDDVIEEIFSSDDMAAVGEMLKNASVSLKEDLLERICDKARTVKSLQAPMVHLPKLPRSVALRLAGFVADHLIEALLARKDLAPDVAKAVRKEVAWRLDLAAEQETTENDESPYEKALRLKREGRLAPDMVAAALKAGQREYAMAAIAALSGISMNAVEQAVGASSAKGLLALSWKAGLSPEIAVTVQQRLGHVPPRDVIKPKNGGFALPEDELEWHLEFMTD